MNIGSILSYNPKEKILNNLLGYCDTLTLCRFRTTSKGNRDFIDFAFSQIAARNGYKCPSHAGAFTYVISRCITSIPLGSILESRTLERQAFAIYRSFRALVFSPSPPNTLNMLLGFCAEVVPEAPNSAVIKQNIYKNVARILNTPLHLPSFRYNLGTSLTAAVDRGDTPLVLLFLQSPKITFEHINDTIENCSTSGLHEAIMFQLLLKLAEKIFSTDISDLAKDTIQNEGTKILSEMLKKGYKEYSPAENLTYVLMQYGLSPIVNTDVMITFSKCMLNYMFIKGFLTETSLRFLCSIKNFPTEVVEAFILNSEEDISKSTLGIYLEIAVRRGSVTLARASLQCGADANAKDINGDAPLHIAVDNRDLKLLELLLEFGSNVNIANGEGKTPLHLAVANNNLEFAELLVGKGAHPNLADNDGNTPLHIAVMYNYAFLAQMLFKLGSDPELKNKLGNSSELANNKLLFSKECFIDSLPQDEIFIPVFQYLHKRDFCNLRLVQKKYIGLIDKVFFSILVQARLFAKEDALAETGSFLFLAQRYKITPFGNLLLNENAIKAINALKVLKPQVYFVNGSLRYCNDTFAQLEVKEEDWRQRLIFNRESFVFKSPTFAKVKSQLRDLAKAAFSDKAFELVSLLLTSTFVQNFCQLMQEDEFQKYPPSENLIYILLKETKVQLRLDDIKKDVLATLSASTLDFMRKRGVFNSPKRRTFVKVWG